jgi:hypothetical protein
MIRLLTSAWLVLLPAFAVSADEFLTDEAAVRQVVADYIAGWREGDVDTLARIFALEHGHIIWRNSDNGVQSITFSEALQKRKPNPGYGQPYRIEHLDIVDGYLAVVRFNVERADKGSYIDYFTLYKTGDGWKIVTKAFTSRPGVLLEED